MLILAGCAISPTITESPAVEKRVPFDVCLMMGEYNPSAAAYVSETQAEFRRNGGRFASLSEVDSLAATATCDLTFRIGQPGTFSVTLDILPGEGGAALWSAKSSGYGGGKKLLAAVMKALDEGTPLHQRALVLRGARLATPAASEAPSAAAPPAPALAATAAPSPSPNYSAKPRPNDLAVVVGIESYSEIETKAPYAERDADAVKAHLRALGVPERNIVLLKGPKAVKSALEKHIGTWLPLMAKPDSRVYFYFSGHGAPDVKNGKAYLVPWDGDPNFLEDTAVPLDRLFARLGALRSRRVLVAMDSCFSGAGGRSVLATGARPLVTKVDIGAAPANLTVLSASSSSEISGSLDDKRHGAFTYFLLAGLDAGKTTPRALLEYLKPQVEDEARRLNRAQTPQLSGDGDWPLR